MLIIRAIWTLGLLFRSEKGIHFWLVDAFEYKENYNSLMKYGEWFNWWCSKLKNKHLMMIRNYKELAE